MYDIFYDNLEYLSNDTPPNGVRGIFLMYYFCIVYNGICLLFSFLGYQNSFSQNCMVVALIMMVQK